MKPTKTTLILSLITTMSLLSINQANADRYAGQVNYDLIVQHSLDLEYIAADLKECYRDSFRHSPFYGKLVSRTARVKNLSHRLHRHGVKRGTCNWNSEIYRLDELVAELRDFTNQAIIRSRYDHPICSTAVRTARRLLAKADFHVNGLRKSLYVVQRPVYREPTCRGPVYNQSAPNYDPRLNFGYRSSGGGNYTSHKIQKRLNNQFRPNPLSNYSQTPGLSFNVGGLKFHLN